METEYQEMKAWQLCQKLSSGEWKESIDDNEIRRRLDKYGNPILLRSDGSWGFCTSNCGRIINAKEYEEPVVYDLTCWEAFDKVLSGEAKKVIREDGKGIVKRHIKYGEYYLVFINPKTGMPADLQNTVEQDKKMKWRAVEKEGV